MLTLEEAREKILADLTPLADESVDLLEARQRVVAEAVQAGHAMPSFDNSAMDGYAVVAADTNDPPAKLDVVEVIPAGGVPQQTLTPGRAARIFTGAPMPTGADAVVMQEDTDLGEQSVVVNRAAKARQHVRFAGEDIQPGAPLLEAGQVMGAGDIGALAAQGRSWVRVVRRPRVAVVPTGDEIVEVDRKLGPGQIYNSNSMLIAAQVAEAGGIPIRCPVAPDDPVELARSLAEAAVGADLIITSGGVSVGELDHVKQVLGQQGHVDFWKVAIKPGKPLAYGRFGGVPLVGLPGNPVSSYVTFELFARPAIRRLAGFTHVLRATQKVALAHPWKRNAKRRELVRARLRRQDDAWLAEIPSAQGSGMLSSMLRVDALLDIPPGRDALDTGAAVEAILLWER